MLPDACTSFNSSRPPFSGLTLWNLAVFQSRSNLPLHAIEAPGALWSATWVRVFSQRAELSLDLAELLVATRRFFDATLEIQSRTEPEDSAELVQVRLRNEKHNYDGMFTIQSRLTTAADLDDARLAEQRGRAAGMSKLAERCPTVWDVRALGAGTELASLNLCGILASVALGPVLPDDRATLYGVRGAMERVDTMLKSRRNGPVG